MLQFLCCVAAFSPHLDTHAPNPIWCWQCLGSRETMRKEHKRFLQKNPPTQKPFKDSAFLINFLFSFSSFLTFASRLFASWRWMMKVYLSCVLCAYVKTMLWGLCKELSNAQMKEASPSVTDIPPTRPFIHHIQMIIVILREWIIWIYYFFSFLLLLRKWELKKKKR